jgi:hypothetical chaperone protein
VFCAVEAPYGSTFGLEGTREYLDGTPWRLMRSLKSLLGNRLIYETTAIGDRDVRFVDVITLYLRTLRLRACDNAEASLDSVVMGRPVRFVDDDAERDREAQETLAACARSAAFATSNSSSSHRGSRSTMR